MGGEGASIARCFRTKDFSIFMSDGVIVEGVRYIFIKDEDGRMVYARGGGEHVGVVLQRTKMAVIIARCMSGAAQTDVIKGVQEIADYLEGEGL